MSSHSVGVTRDQAIEMFTNEIAGIDRQLEVNSASLSFIQPPADALAKLLHAGIGTTNLVAAVAAVSAAMHGLLMTQVRQLEMTNSGMEQRKQVLEKSIADAKRMVHVPGQG
jgi:hypothetical protein